MFRELGLPYVSDPAVTRHLAAFLSTTDAQPDAILFNGGFFIPDILPRSRRRRDGALVREASAGLRKSRSRSRCRCGSRVLLLCASRPAQVCSYAAVCLAPTTSASEPSGDKVRTVCLAPRGSEEGSVLEIDREDLQLVANKAVSFRLYSSLVRTEDQLGEVVEFDANDPDLHLHAPLQAVIRFGKKAEERMIPVKLGVRLTEVGTLEIWADSRVSEHRWRLQFELRKSSHTQESARPAAVISETAMEQARDADRATRSVRERLLAPEELPGKLEQTLALGRNSWPLSTIRQLADWLLEYAEGRGRGPNLEARWLNLGGFCLRPGFGFPGDDFRIEQARRIYASGLRFPNNVECEIQWWIFWGRVAGGLNRNQQTDIYQRLSQTLLPQAGQESSAREHESAPRNVANGSEP